MPPTPPLAATTRVVYRSALADLIPPPVVLDIDVLDSGDVLRVVYRSPETGAADETAMTTLVGAYIALLENVVDAPATLRGVITHPEAENTIAWTCRREWVLEARDDGAGSEATLDLLERIAETSEDVTVSEDA